MRTAQHWHPVSEDTVQCDLCPHRCTIRENGAGRCQARGVRRGELKAIGYGQISSAHIDPIEKKPLYHFHPGSAILSIGGWGCNLACTFCQNWSISQQAPSDGRPVPPREVVERGRTKGSIGIAYTYNEPLISFEYVLDCARLAREAGLVNVLVTNGFINRDPAAELLPYIDALNIDMKSSEDAFYREYCGATLAPVQAFALQAREAGCHVEITDLIIPGLNDATATIEARARWIAEHLGPSIPLHLSAYHPQYKLQVPPTPRSVLETAYDIASQHLDFVFVGNMRTARGQDTHCPHCNALLVERAGYATRVTGLRDGVCAACGVDPGIIGA